MAKSKTPKGQENELGIAARDLSKEQRRELFLKKKKELSKDWRVVQANQEEELTPFNLIALDHGVWLGGLARGGMVYQIHGDEGSWREPPSTSPVPEVNLRPLRCSPDIPQVQEKFVARPSAVGLLPRDQEVYELVHFQSSAAMIACS